VGPASLTQQHSNESEGSLTKASQLAEQLRADIICGKFTPGARLKVQELTKLYGIGSIPMREALSRLVNSGFVDARDQRGFSVRSVSAEELQDLTRIRLLIEPDAFRDSILNGDLAWEERVIAAHHRMQRQSPYVEGASNQLNAGWEAAHDDFHRQLISACASPWLIRLVEFFRDQTTRYRHISIASLRTATRDVTSEHKAIMDAALARNYDLAVKLACDHILTTTSIAASERPGL
jgi:GntR family transcriptional regulator, carbon starvation induced regulator